MSISELKKKFGDIGIPVLLLIVVILILMNEKCDCKGCHGKSQTSAVNNPPVNDQPILTKTLEYVQIRYRDKQSIKCGIPKPCDITMAKDDWFSMTGYKIKEEEKLRENEPIALMGGKLYRENTEPVLADHIGFAGTNQFFFETLAGLVPITIRLAPPSTEKIKGYDPLVTSLKKVGGKQVFLLMADCRNMLQLREGSGGFVEMIKSLLAQTGKELTGFARFNGNRLYGEGTGSQTELLDLINSGGNGLDHSPDPNCRDLSYVAIRYHPDAIFLVTDQPSSDGYLCDTKGIPVYGFAIGPWQGCMESIEQITKNSGGRVVNIIPRDLSQW